MLTSTAPLPWCTQVTQRVSVPTQPSRTSATTYQCGGHHLLKPLGLGLVVEIHAAHKVIPWKRPGGCITSCSRLPCQRTGPRPCLSHPPRPGPLISWWPMDSGGKARGEERQADKEGGDLRASAPAQPWRPRIQEGREFLMECVFVHVHGWVWTMSMCVHVCQAYANFRGLFPLGNRERSCQP